MNIFIFTLAVYGISTALVYFNGPFDIISKFRDFVTKNTGKFGEVFSCMFCLPTNIGILLSIIALISGVYFTPCTNIFGGTCLWWLSVIMDGFYCGGTTYFLNTLQEKMEITKINYTGDMENV
jgi:hypothetical protein